MAVNKKLKEAGWFYHAPAKKIDSARVDAPAPSQIPGIGFEDPTLLEKEEVRSVMFKDTDSKYIQMAKMGGRKDLLCINPELYKKKHDGPKGYHRNEWFYLEDNRAEDEDKKKEESWDFLLPDYMVHKNYQPSFEEPGNTPVRGGAPFATEKISILESEGRSATDKTVKIPNVRRPGFGVRNEKPAAAIKSIAPREKGQGERKKGKPDPMQMPTETDEPTMMSKLMAGGYEKDWYEKRAEVTGRDQDCKAQKKQPPSAHTANVGQRKETSAHPSDAGKTTSENKALFKLSKFKNVESKVFAHQSMDPNK